MFVFLDQPVNQTDSEIRIFFNHMRLFSSEIVQEHYQWRNNDF